MTGRPTPAGTPRLRVLVTGGRAYADRDGVVRALDELHAKHGVAVLIQGGAGGADWHARAWAASRGVECVTVPADWRRFGAQAGPLRNSAMLNERPDVVVAFPGGRGTADMEAKATRRGIPVLRGEWIRQTPPPASPTTGGAA